MDLGIAGRWALVCAASKGLGLGCARALVREGVNVVVAARGEDALDRAPSAGDLKAWLKDRLIAYQLPAHFRYVVDFPRTPSMKPSAEGLRALFEDAS